MSGYCEYFKCDIDDYEQLEKLREEFGGIACKVVKTVNTMKSEVVR